MKCLLLSQKIAEYTKKDIDNGFCPEEIYQICCCLRTCFCLSYAIRKDNDLYIYFLENNTAVKFIGDKLRFLGPDERSQALLLYKAIKKRNKRRNIDRWIDSTPGIYIKEYDEFSSFFKEFISLNEEKPFLVENNGYKSNLNTVEILKNGESILTEEGSYIFPLDEVSISNLLMDHSFLKNSGIEIINFETLKTIHDQILIINYWLDTRENQ